MLNANFKAMKNDYKKKPLKKETLPWELINLKKSIST